MHLLDPEAADRLGLFAAFHDAYDDLVLRAVEGSEDALWLYKEAVTNDWASITEFSRYAASMSVGYPRLPPSGCEELWEQLLSIWHRASRRHEGESAMWMYAAPHLFLDWRGVLALAAEVSALIVHLCEDMKELLGKAFRYSKISARFTRERAKYLRALAKKLRIYMMMADCSTSEDSSQSEDDHVSATRMLVARQWAKVHGVFAEYAWLASIERRRPRRLADRQHVNPDVLRAGLAEDTSGNTRLPGRPKSFEEERQFCTDAGFQKLYAVSKDQFEFLLHNVGISRALRKWKPAQNAHKANKTVGCGPIAPDTYFLMYLMFLRCASYPHVSAALRIGEGTCKKCLPTVAKIVKYTLRPYMDFPLGDLDALDAIAKGQHHIPTSLRSMYGSGPCAPIVAVMMAPCPRR